MAVRNYQKELDELIHDLCGRTPRLLLHSCCAPCSSYVLEYLSNYFAITVYYYNPNIFPPSEYDKRVLEQHRFIMSMETVNPVLFRSEVYEPEMFYQCVQGMEQLPEGAARCDTCYKLRLRKTAMLAKAEGFDYFTTTLSISPMKNAGKINEIGEALAKEFGISHLPSDFKKKNGYKRSVELSAEYGMYRQNYCGCEFSLRGKS